MATPLGRRGAWLAMILALAGALALMRSHWMWILPFGDPGPPPGRLIDVGGFRVHLACEGEGRPAVVLDAGSGDAWLTWFQVQPALAKVTRVCSYDRAGIGYSDPGPRPRSRRRIVEELRTLLHRAGVPPPYVLVGHSFGGLDARLYAGLHPREVAGLVLLDSSHEDHWAHAPREFKERHSRQIEEERLLAEKAERGEPMPRILTIPELPWRARRQLGAVSRRPAWYRASYDELLIADASPREFAAVPRTLDVPLLVLSAGERQRPPDRPLELHERWVRVAAELQNDLAARSPRSRHLTVEGAGHSIHRDRPDVVIRELTTFVSNLRAPLQEK
ncbi:MAG TPA: alpha/beta hydrolase [Thermoanaerobaculia bacterium]|nr:alpha/beta hydrolase [Thermoanaerobaculia bacterium]